MNRCEMGGGSAVFTLETLGRIPGAQPVIGAFLPSASISSDYVLADALRMTRLGLVNVSNIDDQWSSTRKTRIQVGSHLGQDHIETPDRHMIIKADMW